MFSCSCDTMVAMSDVTEDSSIIFEKTSDREPTEPLLIRYILSGIYPLNSKVQTTCIELLRNFILRQIQKIRIILTNPINSKKTTNKSEVIVFVRSLSN